MSHHFKGLSFTVLHVVNLLGCTLKPTYPVRILYINGSAWKSGSLQNDAWIRRNRKRLPAFDLHLMVASCIERKTAIWIWWTDGLVSLKRTDLFQYWISPSGRWRVFFPYTSFMICSLIGHSECSDFGVFLVTLYTPVILQYVAM